jgi:stage V sporulation protein AA
MGDTLYIQTIKNVEVYKPQIYLQDIAKLSGNNQKVLNRNEMRLILTLPEGKSGRYVVSAIDIIREIQKKEESIEVSHIGEATFIITYEKQKHMHALFSWCKTIGVCLITFIGAAFSIMTFHNDVDVSSLFFHIYKQFTGEIPDGATILEFTYSLGIGLGVVFFFNHFGSRKLTQDPTPMEVEMRLYEEDINKTLIEEEYRKRKE